MYWNEIHHIFIANGIEEQYLHSIRRMTQVNSKIRISSILEAYALSSTFTGLQTFNLSDLELPCDLDFELPTNLRLGHLVENIVSELIRSSSNYIILYENIQIQKNQ